jgi:c-di-GMP-binding flagellar brake protein YcgR
MKERRNYKRHIAILPAKIETMLMSGEKTVFEVETRNISIGGAFIYSEDLSFFKKGKPVSIDFTIPSGRYFKYLEDIKLLLDGQGSMVRATSEGIGIHFDRDF